MGTRTKIAAFSKAKGNVLYVLSGDTFHETSAAPWGEAETWSPKAGHAFDAIAGLDDPDSTKYLLLCDGRSKSYRRHFEDLTEANGKCKHISELWIVYKPTRRTGRREGFASSNREACFLVTPCPRTTLKAKSREAGTEGNAAGELTTHSSTYTDVTPLSWLAQPLISTADKAVIFGRECPEPPKKMFDAASGEPLFWNDRKTAALWKQIVSDVGAVAVYDLSPGCGWLAKHCLESGIPYAGVCHHEKQVSFLQNVLDRAAVEAMTKRGLSLYCQDTAALIHEHFSDITDYWRELELREDTVFDDDEE